MPKSIFLGIKRQHVLQALKDLDEGIEHNFEETAGHKLIHSHKSYVPKAVIGIACRYFTGQILSSSELSGADNLRQANHVLKSLGFEIQPIETSSSIHRRYWWVNQNKTHDVEISGGYIWSPKRNKNGARNQFYENMREVSPGDWIFSFHNQKIGAIGTATSNAYESPKPEEYGLTGKSWESVGWRVDVTYIEQNRPVVPKNHINQIRSLLPAKYSPLQQNGDGLQSVYLASLGYELAQELINIIVDQGNNLPMVEIEDLITDSSDTYGQVDDLLVESIRHSAEIEDTEKEQLITARKGQGKFRTNVQKFEVRCRLTGVSDKRLLIASHIKPWRNCSDIERLDGENGLFLTPTVDALFDRGFISFTEVGDLLISPCIDKGIVKQLGIDADACHCGSFTTKQQEYLSYHRKDIFLSSSIDQ